MSTRVRKMPNRGPAATIQCPHCGAWPDFWIRRSFEGKASEFKPRRFCPGCRKEVAA